MDLDYGRDSRLRRSVSALGLSYVAGIQPNVLMWTPGTGPRRPDKSLNNNGRRNEPDLISAKEVARAPRARLEHDPLARRLGRLAVLALRTGARTRRVQWCNSWTGRRGVAADRMAGRRDPTRQMQILALHSAGRYQLSPTRRYHQNALADRARLPGTQAGGRARTLRRARMARLPSPRHAVHRSLRIPGLRAGRDSPLSRPFLRAALGACSTRPLSTPRIHPCGLNATSQIRSPPCVRD
jgi:hypothetical protein